MDDLDRRLVGALHVAPRAPWDALAGVLGADSSTLKRRYDRLTADRVVRVVGELSWGLHSTATPVHVYLDIAGETPLGVIDRLRKLPNMQNLAQLSGRFPVYAAVHAPSEPATSEALDELYATPGVRRVVALPSLRSVRRGALWDPGLVSSGEREQLAELVEATGRDRSNTGAPEKPLSEPERAIVVALVQDGRAGAATIARAAGVPTSTTHRLLRRLLAEGWVRPRVEIQSELLGFLCNFHLRLRARPGCTRNVLGRLAELPQVRLAAHVAGDMSVLCAGLATDRAALTEMLDHQVAAIPDIEIVAVDVVLAERRRYWLDRDPLQGLGEFNAPPLL